MRSFMSIFGLIFLLIMAYLLVANSSKTVAVINALATPSLDAIKTLQGR
jgi:ABC-type uncharacterized transport system substrate-binding protein